MAKFVLHYPGADFEVEGESVMSLIDGLNETGTLIIPTSDGPVGLVTGGIPIYVTEKPDGRVYAI